MNFLFFMVFLAMILDWIADYKGWKKIEYFAKPSVMLFLFAWLFFSTNSLSGFTIWFGVGLLLSLAGDVFLMLSERWFIAGLVAFLLAHVAYIIGLNPTLPPFNIMGLFMAALIGILAARLYQNIAAGLLAKGKDRLQKPVLVYTATISIVLLSALLTFSRPDWDSRVATIVSIGTALFMLSDAILAWNKFVQPIKYGRVMNLGAYHLGQTILIYGVVMQFG